jgi:2-polyprenyl-6-methoxyphenol hydroxylase-like FAD-dependent oxidoreductase
VTHPICLPQLQTESVLADCFVKAGGEILRGYAFTEHSTGKLERSKTTVLQPYQHEADPIEVHSDWLFGCDGFHSTVRSSLGIEYPGDSLTVRPYAVDLDLSHWPFETNVNVFLEPQGGCLAVQIGENQVRLVTTTDAQREAFLRSLPVEKITWDSRFDVHFHVAQSSGLEHTWLAGDAVHVHSPVGGRGMNMGMMDSIVLAESIASGDLEHYAKQRHAVASDWVRFNRRISTIALDSTASSLRARRIITSVLPVLAKIMGPRLANTAFSRLSDSNLRMQKSPS